MKFSILFIAGGTKSSITVKPKCSWRFAAIEAPIKLSSTNKYVVISSEKEKEASS